MKNNIYVYINRIRLLICALLVSSITMMLCACNAGNGAQSAANIQGNEEPTPTVTPTSEKVETSPADGETEGYGDTFQGKTNSPEEGNVVDLIMFMGQYNMSGEGGDASLAPKVSEEAGMEFRPISDPTRLYRIEEPFGANENNPSGLNEFPGVKKGSLVSSFVNEYHDLTGRRVIAVSASMSNTDMEIWTSEGVMTDVRQRLENSVSYLENNGYKIGHIYGLWLHGEADGLKGSTADSYKNSLEKIMTPMFKAGLEKLFIITPGRTIDYTDIYNTIVESEIDLCKKNNHYAIATTVLSKVSTEYMVDQYHYNQHVLNYVGQEAAKSVAYYTQNNVEKIVYDFKEGEYIVPNGVDKNSQMLEEPVHPSDVDINKL